MMRYAALYLDWEEKLGMNILKILGTDSGTFLRYVMGPTQRFKIGTISKILETIQHSPLMHVIGLTGLDPGDYFHGCGGGQELFCQFHSPANLRLPSHALSPSPFKVAF